MKITILNKTDRTGGAAIAAKRLKDALSANGVEVSMLVQKKLTGDLSVHQTCKGYWARYKEFTLFVAERLYFYFFEKSKSLRFAFSPAFAGENVLKNKWIVDADVIHIHWFNQGFLSLCGLEKLTKLNKPIVWTLHDMWAFTGGCHYAGECENYKAACGNCPILKKSGQKDLSARILKKKQRIYQNPNIRFVTCSEWLAQKARKSMLLKNSHVQSIPNPIDTSLYMPGNKEKSRDKLALPLDKKLLLFGAANVMDERKGIKYLLAALKHLVNENSCWKNDLEIILFGKSDEEFVQEIPFKVYNKGLVSGDLNIIDLYRSADVFVLPSLEDNLPNTIMESMACGTPVVAFNTGGIPEMITHLKNGYVSEYKSIEDLAKGVLYILDHPNPFELSKAAVDWVTENYSQSVVARRYIELYQSAFDA